MSSLGHVATTATLERFGVSRRQRERALRNGELYRVLRGWWATPLADSEQLRAIRLGGRIGCVSALGRWGAWSGIDGGLHVTFPRNGRCADRPRTATGAIATVAHPHATAPVYTAPVRTAPVYTAPVHTAPVHTAPVHAAPANPAPGNSTPVGATPSGPSVLVHWRNTHFSRGQLDWIVSPQDALAQALRCQNDEHAIACIDSALHLGVVTDPEWHELRRTLPVSLQPLTALIEPGAESGVESTTRVRLVKRGHRVVSQARIPGVGRLDLLVDDLVGLEVDGDAFHSSWEQRRTDISRVLGTLRWGYPTIRVGYHHVFNQWDEVCAALDELLAIARAARTAR